MGDDLGFISFYIYDGIRYFSNVDYNGLFCQNIENKEINFIDFFPNETVTKRFIHRSVIGNGEKMFFFPLFGKGITEYDLKSKEFRYLEINDKNGSFGISGTLCHHKEIILIPSNLSGCFLIFNTDTFEVKYVNVLKKIFNQHGIDRCAVDLFGSVLYEECIYIALCGTNLIAEIDLNSYQVSIHAVETGTHFRNINIFDESLWATTTDNGIVLRVNLNSWEVEKIQLAGLVNFPWAVLTVEKWNDQIIVIPGMGYQIFRLTDGVFKPLNQDVPENMLGDVVGYMIDENLNLYSQKGSGEIGKMNGGCTVVSHDLKNGIYKKELKFQNYEFVKRNILNRCMKDGLDKRGYLSESSQDTYYTLSNYLEWITNNELMN